MRIQFIILILLCITTVFSDYLPHQNLSNSIEISHHSNLFLAENDSIYVFWIEGTNQIYSRIFHEKSWTPIIPIYTCTAPNTIEELAASSNDDSLYLFWIETDSMISIYSGIVDGFSFSNIELIYHTTNLLEKLKTKQGRVLGWLEKDSFYGSKSALKIISPPNFQMIFVDSLLAYQDYSLEYDNSNRLHAFWLKNGNEIHYKSLIDSTNWSPTQIIYGYHFKDINCCYNPVFQVVVGGVESVIGHHTRLLAEAGHAVRILAGRGGQTDERIRFVRLPLVDSRHPEVLAAKAELDAGRLPPNFSLLVERIREHLGAALAGVDRVIAHNVCSLHKNLALTAALRQLVESGRAPRLILWHHDLAWTTPRYRHELHDGYPWDLLRTDWAEATQVVVSAARQQELAELLAVPSERVRVIPNGVDTARFLKLESLTQQLIRRFDLLSAAPLLLLPVRITTRKNIELALRVLAALRESLPHAVLVVTWPLGPHNPANAHYFEKLLALRRELGLQNAAHFLAEWSEDYLPDEVIADFYRLADALVFPSREEGFGIPILEAGLAGIPVFCADIPTLQELGGDDVIYFATDANPGEVAAQMSRWFLTDPTYRLRERVRSR